MRGGLAAITAAFLFGLSATIFKLVAGEVGPIFTGGVMTLASAPLFLALSAAGVRFRPKDAATATPSTSTRWPHLDRRSVLLLSVVTAAGGLFAPILFFRGVALTTASTASLLMIAEPALTILFAFILLKERMTGREYLAAGAMLAAAIVVATNLDFTRVDPRTIGALLVILAGLCWAVDNNASTPLSRRADLMTVVTPKTGIGGGLLVAVSLVVEGIPRPGISTIALLILGGAATVAVAVVLLLYSFRHIGAMRGGALFATTTLFGAATAVIVLGESLTPLQVAAGAVMLAASLGLAAWSATHSRTTGRNG